MKLVFDKEVSKVSAYGASASILKCLLQLMLLDGSLVDGPRRNPIPSSADVRESVNTEQETSFI